MANSAPVNMTLSSGSIHENSAPGAYIGTFSGIDADLQDVLTFSIVDDPDQKFVLVGNELRLREGAHVDFESAASHNLTVKVQDQDGASKTATFTVNVLDLQETLNVEGTLSVDKHSVGGAVIGKLKAYGSDAGTFTYEIISDPDSKFAVAGDQLVLRDGARVDSETKEWLTTTVKATNAVTGQVTTGEFSVRITKEAETVNLIGSGWIKENTPGGTVLGKLEGHGSKVGTYAFEIVEDKASKFAIVGSDLVLRTNAHVDFEKDEWLYVKVKATNATTGQVTTGTLSFGVWDVVETVRAAPKARAIDAGNGADIVIGNGGDNVIKAGGGNDRVSGGYGNDMLRGGEGADTFVFNSRLNTKKNVDKILDFSSKDDTIEIAKSVFSKLQKGHLKADAFHVGKAAADGSDRIIYDKTKNSLYYDRDGNGGAEQIKFATLQAKDKLALSDFMIV